MRVLGGISHNSGKTVLNTLQAAKIKSRESSKQGITVVKMTSDKCSFKRKIPSEFKISDMNKSSLTGILDMERQ